jgi:mannose-6-phosphate isomerase-like protein (cupin superfamily)
MSPDGHQPIRIDDAAATDDLNVTVVRLRPDEALPEHVNDQLDVLLVVLQGDGTLTCDGATTALGPSTPVVVVPKGARRQITAGPGGLAYVSAHQRQPGLHIG